MKKRFINVIKWFFIILGVLFFIQLLLLIGALKGAASFADASINVNNDKSSSLKLKPLQPIIKYAEDYQAKNGKYPEKIENVKINPNLYFKYEPSKDFNCYTITSKEKNGNLTKQYQHCLIKSEHSSSTSESFVEYTSK